MDSIEGNLIAESPGPLVRGPGFLDRENAPWGEEPPAVQNQPGFSGKFLFISLQIGGLPGETAQQIARSPTG